MTTPEPPRYSVIVPVHRNESTLRELHRRLTEVAIGLGAAMEIVFVDDASPDTSWEIISELARDDRRVRGVRLRENVRQARAMFAGMEVAGASTYILMDADLDHPPEFIPTLVDRHLEGHDFVVTRRNRPNRPGDRRVAAAALRTVMRIVRMPDYDIGSSFILIDDPVERHVREELVRSGVQLVTPTAWASSSRPLSVDLAESMVRRRDPEPRSSYQRITLAKIGTAFLLRYVVPRIGRASIAIGIAGAAASFAARGGARRRLHQSSVALCVGGLLLASSRRAVRRDPTAPLYEIDQIV